MCARPTRWHCRSCLAIDGGREHLGRERAGRCGLQRAGLILREMHADCAVVGSGPGLRCIPSAARCTAVRRTRDVDCLVDRRVSEGDVRDARRVRVEPAGVCGSRAGGEQQARDERKWHHCFKLRGGQQQLEPPPAVYRRAAIDFGICPDVLVGMCGLCRCAPMCSVLPTRPRLMSTVMTSSKT